MQARSAMCAIGSHETSRPSSGKAITWSKPLIPAIGSRA